MRHLIKVIWKATIKAAVYLSEPPVTRCINKYCIPMSILIHTGKRGSGATGESTDYKAGPKIPP